MPIPTYDALLLPVLRLSANRLWVMRDLVAKIADDLNLSDDERAMEIPSGGTKIIASRVHWAKTYLKQAGLLEQPRRAAVQISQRGRELLATNPSRIDLSLLQQFDDFRSFMTRTKQDFSPRGKIANSVAAKDDAKAPLLLSTNPITSTPDDQIEAAHRALELLLRDALMLRLLESSPTFFEKVILDLLLAMGYGGSRIDAGERLGGTGDGGVDGVIREDQLGLSRVYLQAKRYQSGKTVGSDAVQAFIGALHLKGSQKGVFITTSEFTKAAMAAASAAGNLRVVLIDGQELTRLMVRFGVGVRTIRNIELKKIDLDYFGDADLE